LDNFKLEIAAFHFHLSPLTQSNGGGEGGKNFCLVKKLKIYRTIKNMDGTESVSLCFVIWGVKIFLCISLFFK